MALNSKMQGSSLGFGSIRLSQGHAIAEAWNAAGLLPLRVLLRTERNLTVREI